MTSGNMSWLYEEGDMMSGNMSWLYEERGKGL